LLLGGGGTPEEVDGRHTMKIEFRVDVSFEAEVEAEVD
jgi:hypothetical protein